MYNSAKSSIAWAFFFIIFLCTQASQSQAETTNACNSFQSKEGVFIAAKNPRPMVDEAFTIPSGKMIRLSQLKGRALLINFWTSWCPPCIREMPSMDRLQARFSDKDLTILPLTRDPGGTRSAARFYDRHKLTNLPIVADRWGKVAYANHVGSTYPRTLFIDRKGREVGRFVGGADWEDPIFIETLKNCLGVEVAR
jgi:thiol-disulfide isomerase/thioredoxin